MDKEEEEVEGAGLVRKPNADSCVGIGTGGRGKVPERAEDCGAVLETEAPTARGTAV